MTKAQLIGVGMEIAGAAGISVPSHTAAAPPELAGGSGDDGR